PQGAPDRRRSLREAGEGDGGRRHVGAGPSRAAARSADAAGRRPVDTGDEPRRFPPSQKPLTARYPDGNDRPDGRRGAPGVHGVRPDVRKRAPLAPLALLRETALRTLRPRPAPGDVPAVRTRRPAGDP